MLNFYLSVLNTEEEKNQFADLYLKYRDGMQKIAYSILHNNEDAEDAVHTAFLSIANNFEKISSLSSQKIKSYFVITIRNTSFNLYNKNKKYKDKVIDIDNDNLYIPINIDFFENYDYERLVKSISELKPIYRDVLYLYYINDHSAKEIAKILDISVSAVWKRIERAKNSLKEILEKGDVYVWY